MRILGAIALAWFSIACAPLDERPSPERFSHAVALEALRAVLPGDYATVADDRASALEPARLRITPLHRPGAHALRLMLTQSQSAGDARRFLLEITTGTEEGLLGGVIATLDASNAPTLSCTLDVTIRQDGFSAQTDPEDCRFGSSGQRVGLLKELAFDGQQLVIADRVMPLDAGAGDLPDQVYVFQRIVRFRGWAAIREASDWRMAAPFEIDSAGGRIQPLDAVGMPLGMIVELTRIGLPNTPAPILELRLVDATDGHTLARAWADRDARSIGVAVKAAQVGLERLAPD